MGTVFQWVLKIDWRDLDYILYLCFKNNTVVFKEENKKKWTQLSEKTRNNIDDHEDQPDVDEGPDEKCPSWRRKLGVKQSWDIGLGGVKRTFVEKKVRF